ncbi:MAG: hypothetical protein NT092_03785 [Bacteroidia bacterium]|nr:hypothetical protein [Bacteroidia bacterium]
MANVVNNLKDSPLGTLTTTITSSRWSKKASGPKTPGMTRPWSVETEGGSPGRTLEGLW